MTTQKIADDRIALLQGTLDLLILKTLVLGPCHGQGVARSIQRQSEEVFFVDHGSLYLALQQAGRQKVDQREVGREREQSQGAVLLVDGEGARAACGEDERVAAADEGDGIGSGGEAGPSSEEA